MMCTRFGPLCILAPPGVYAPRSDTALLAGEIGSVRDATVLELCAGTGALALTAARRGAAKVVTVDCGIRAVLAVRANARLNCHRLHARRGDLFDAVGVDERFDVILANPPYLPTVGLGSPPDARWDAGTDGRLVLDRIIDGASSHLTSKGRLVLVQSALANLGVTYSRLAENGLRVLRLRKHRGPFGPIASSRRVQLVSSGAISREDTYETLAVVTAEKLT